MKQFLFILDLVGFLALSTLAVLASLLSSLLRWILAILIRIVSKLVRALRRLKTNFVEITTASKNGTKWHRLRIGSYSFMIGRKENDC